MFFNIVHIRKISGSPLIFYDPTKLTSRGTNLSILSLTEQFVKKQN